MASPTKTKLCRENPKRKVAFVWRKIQGANTNIERLSDTGKLQPEKPRNTTSALCNVMMTD